jgi:hypothetical protein
MDDHIHVRHGHGHVIRLTDVSLDNLHRKLFQVLGSPRAEIIQDPQTIFKGQEKADQISPDKASPSGY